MKTLIEFDNYRQEQALEDYIETTLSNAAVQQQITF